MKTSYYKYDTEKYNFKKILLELYSCEDLEEIKDESKHELSLGKDTHSKYHKLFFDKLNNGWDEFNDIYYKLIKEIIYPIIGENKILYQSSPSFRIQYNNSKAVTTLHCDSDELHKHPDGEINFVIFLTEMKDTSAIWIESKPDLGDYTPIEGDFGMIAKFNGNKCRHFNKINTTGKTRISLDFRILSFSKYDPEYSAKSATQGAKFIIGEYYNLYDGTKNV